MLTSICDVKYAARMARPKELYPRQAIYGRVSVDTLNYIQGLPGGNIGRKVDFAITKLRELDKEISKLTTTRSTSKKRSTAVKTSRG